ncbi:hypothetical protein ES707_18378 [subsurface metagenome]
MKIGYAQGELEGDWAVFAKIAGYFAYRVPPEDREDFLHDLLVEMVKVKEKYDAKGKTLTEAGLMWVAKYRELTYWDKRRLRLYGLNCGNCTIEQRRECRTIGLSPKCPKGKAVRLLSLDTPGENGDGHKLTKINELITDYKAGDPTHRLDAKLDARRILKSLPKKLVKIGYKVYAGIPLENEEKEYLEHWQKAYRLVKRRDHLGERILKQLRKNPQGKTRSGLASNLNVYVRELNYDLNRLIKGQQVIAVKRERPSGRPMTPLLFLAGVPIPEVRMDNKERDEHIRQDHYDERDERIRQAHSQGWNIRRITRELHHDRRTILRAIYGIKVKRR